MNFLEALAKAKKEIVLKDAEILLTETVQVSPAFLLAHPETEMSIENQQFFFESVAKRKKGFGVWDILGKKNFFGFDFFINANVLTPRPETEILLEKTLAFITQEKTKTIVDMGTGSGCLAVCIAKKYPTIEVFAIDISAKALETTQKNASFHGVDIVCVESDLWENISENLEKKLHNAVVITNLPYIPDTDEVDMATHMSDPALALFSGTDGMDLYRRFFEELPSGIRAVFFEFHPPQKVFFEEIVHKKFPQARLEFFADYSGHVRFGSLFL